MRHIQVGLIIGGILLILAILVAASWWMLDALVGPIAATIGLGLIALVTMLVIVIDWWTERKENQ